MIAGIDEAGRGPVIGPLVLCGVLVSKEQEEELSQLGVTDSKLLSPTKRELLYDEIISRVTAYHVIVVHPDEIDARFEKGLTLNTLEAAKSALIIQKLKPQEVIIDCPSTNPKTYVADLNHRIGLLDVKIIAEYKADLHYTCVAAASIIAKVTRDREIQKLHAKYGDFGSGYPSDPKTKEFLERYFHAYPIFRKSWESYKRLQIKQKGLNEF